MSSSSEGEDSAVGTQSPPEAPLAQDAFEDFSEEQDLESELEESDKDEAERQLENLVFGDDAGFKAGLTAYQASQAREHRDDDEISDEPQDRALATVDDADLFFLDSGPDERPSVPSANLGSSSDSIRHRRPPAWEDSEDERMMVSLMALPRLRKLRQYEGEDIISGKEYTRRLRQQFELLTPRPKWADWNSNSKSKKRRRGSTGTESSASQDTPDEEDMDLSDSDFSTLPLTRLLQSNESLTQSSQKLSNKRRRLQPEVISVERMKDIQPTQPSAITSLSIHPSLPLLLSAGPSSTLYLHHLLPHPVPPEPPNPLITSLHLKNTPLSTAAFSPSPMSSSILSEDSGPRIYLSSRRRYFHVWDLPTGAIRKITRIYGHSSEQRSMEILKPSPCGRYVALKGSSRKGGGIVNVLDAATLQWILQVRVEGHKGVGDFAWWRNGEGISVVGRGGEVSEWSLQEGKIVARWQDEGAVGTTTVALGGQISPSNIKEDGKAALGTDRWIAIGSSAGIVNVYDRAKFMNVNPAPNPQPTKTLDHLTTPISHLAFSPCGQLLVMASRWKRDALRLVHMPSCTVYRNWPTSKTPLGRISAVAFGEYTLGEGEDSTKALVMAVGNEAGSLRAWELGG